MRILVVDDDRAVRDALRRALTLAGYEVQMAEGGQQALTQVATGVPDAVVLDIGMPDIDGLEVCRRLRGSGNRVPILMLTARDAVADRIDGLDAGADDYLVKPFDVGELKARLRALMRRSNGEGDPDALSFAELKLDSARHGVTVNEEFAELTRTEYQLLELLMLNPRRVLPHGLIYDRVWGYDFGPASNALRVYVGYLRRKLEEAGSRELIHTIRGVGYVLREPVNLRTRMAAVAGAAVAVTVVALAVTQYEAARSTLRGQIDQALRERGTPLAFDRGQPGNGQGRPGDGDGRDSPPPNPFGDAAGKVQYVSPSGVIVSATTAATRLPVSARTKELAAAGSGSFFSDVTVQGVHLRVLTVGRGERGAAQIARPLTEVDRALRQLLWILLAVGAGGIVVAAVLGGVVARAALAPVSRFTRRTEALTANPDLSQRLDIEGQDELARLARSFNATLDALEQSAEAQRHLVADASHELRTPIASLRANIQVLQDADRLPEEERASLRADIIAELDELTALVGDVVELARGAKPSDVVDDVRIDQIVRQLVERAERRWGDALVVRTTLQPTVVSGEPERISRAISNLLGNAHKWSPPGGLVEVALSDGALTIRDHGPGFDDADLPHVFDRFYRADSARGMPGSGLGLAIVRQAAEAHGGSVSAANAPGGGALMTVSFGASHPVNDADGDAGSDALGLPLLEQERTP